MATQQPEWELVGTIGDRNPVEYGGGYVFRDKTGVYDPEVEWVEPMDGAPKNGVTPCMTVYRVPMERHTYIDGILSDNPHHPALSVWYADDLDSLCRCCDCDRDEMIENLCSTDPVANAWAYETLASYHGWYEFDQDPLTLTADEAEKRYEEPKYHTV
jgi:hypothetical protein